jgi:hypothetical protein
MSLNPEVICACTFIFFQSPALHFVFVRCVPGSENHFAATAHGLRVRGHHADSAQIVQHVFGGYGFGADAGLGEGDVFGDIFGEMVADH